jgi:hypothetical protein
MKCLDCGGPNLKARIELVYDVPMAARGGGIKVGGMKVTQLDLRAAWEASATKVIFCHDCLAEHTYDDGLKRVEPR